MKTLEKIVWIIVILLSVSCNAKAQQAKQYDDGKRGKVSLPLGDLSFADKVTDHSAGTGKIISSASHPNSALGPPNYSGDVDDGSFLSLGCDGWLVLQFTDNALVDRLGPDLYVFEVGPKVEGTKLEISTDGKNWINVVNIDGGRTEVDIAHAVPSGTSYRFVKLTDDGKGCGTRFAGADIDSVAAIGSALRFVLDGEVLFAHDSSEIKLEARAVLTNLSLQISNAGVSGFQVVGHTDSSGSDAYNQTLSEARAHAVRSFFAQLDVLSGIEIIAVGRGETEPVASNENDAGRRINRRVEIIGSS